jgi:succinate dehydrogenase / fumarate reductase cytochrome b subunit
MRSPAERPLSPHLQVYRPMYTMVLSILHRASGLFLSACSLLFVAWLVAAAAGPECYAMMGRFFSTLGARLVLLLALGSFWYHLFAGIRHLAWDLGFGFEKSSARASAAVVLVCAASAFGATLLLTPAWRWLWGAP